MYGNFAQVSYGKKRFNKIGSNLPRHPALFSATSSCKTFEANIGNNQRTSGQSYKHFTLVNYNSRVVIWGIFKSGTTLES